MASYTSIYYGAPVNADIINKHMAGVVAPGIYKGLYVRSAGASSRVLDIRNVETGDMDTEEVDGGIHQQEYYGLAFTSEGVRIEETSPLRARITVPDSSSGDRIDLVYLQYEFKKVIPSKNLPSFGLLKGEAASAGEEPVSPLICTNEEAAEYAQVTVQALTQAQITNALCHYSKIRIPMAYVRVKATSQYITDEDIINIPRVMTTDQIVDYISEALYGSLGNFRTYGWSLSSPSGALDVNISAGRGLIGGKLCVSGSTKTVTGIKPRIQLMPSRNAGANLSLSAQIPSDCPSCLRVILRAPSGKTVNVTHVDPTTSQEVPTSFSISGTWIEGSTEVTGTKVYAIPNKVTSAGLVILTDPFISVDADGVDFEDFATPIQSFTCTVEITNQPRAYIYAQSQLNRLARFVYDYDPKRAVTSRKDDYLLGYVETDEDSIETVFEYASSDVIDSFTSQLNGVLRSFTLSSRPIANSETVYLDGLALEKNSPLGLGYTINYDSNTITLQSNVPTPDGANAGMTGSNGASLWVKYRRKG